ncbi:MAG: phytanoyl-CoA dioxygenase, partial [Candidatus Rokuibacteriota bacterium]
MGTPTPKERTESGVIRFEDLSVDYGDFDESSRPYLDRRLRPVEEAALDDQQRFWREHGYLLLKGFMPTTLVDAYCCVREALNNVGGWGPVPYLYHEEIRDFCLYRPLLDVLEKLVGDRLILHLNLTGWISTERDWHQDDYLNPPFVRGSYLAIWAALDHISPDSGPFEFVPGSHWWRVLSQERVKHFLSAADALAESVPGQEERWIRRSERIVHDATLDYIARKGGEVKQFLGEKGDVLVWHGCLLHRGSIPKRPGMLRKALIAHYSGVTNRTDFPSQYTMTHE